MDLLSCAEEVRPAVASVFGRALVARDLDAAMAWATPESGLDCVTLEGDKVERRGLMRGGHVRGDQSVLAARREVAAQSSRVETAAAAAAAAEAEASRLDQELAGIRGERQRLDADRKRRAERAREARRGAGDAMRRAEVERAEGVALRRRLDAAAEARARATAQSAA